MLKESQIKEIETCERQRLMTESPDTSVGTFKNDSQSIAIDESSNLAVLKEKLYGQITISTVQYKISMFYIMVLHC